MRVVITGASGFIGRGLAEHLCREPHALGRPISALVLADLAANEISSDVAPNLAVEWHLGDLANPADLDGLLRQPVDCVFHLASLPGSAAEGAPERGLAANLSAPLALATRLARQARERGIVPRIVFASSIAVYGPLGPGVVGEDVVPHPAISYGAHKLMTEVFLADLSRRGEIDSRSLRLPGVVARPMAESGHGSAFMSLLFHKAARGEPYICPVDPEATAWWLSREVCIANLSHAARMEVAALPASRVWQSPALHAPIADIVSALTRRFGTSSTSAFRFEPVEAIEAQFGRLPSLSTPRAIADGFRVDADPDALVAAVTASVATEQTRA